MLEFLKMNSGKVIETTGGNYVAGIDPYDDGHIDFLPKKASCGAQYEKQNEEDEAKVSFDNNVDVGDYPLPEQPTAEELREVSQIRNLIGYARYVSLTYGSHWVHIRFTPNERQIAYLKNKGYKIYRKEELEENGIASHKRVYTYSLNWSGISPIDTNLVEV